MNKAKCENSINLGILPEFIPSQIFDCGQCFRFEEIGEEKYAGVAFGEYLEVQKTSNGIILSGSNPDNNLWSDFFDLDNNYREIIDELSEISENFGDGGAFRRAAEFGSGIRILKQDPFEALISFIISQNNNIPRIKKIIASLCETYGESFTYNGKTYHTFPSAEALYNAGEKALFDLRTGFRAKYIYDAAKRVCSGETDLEYIAALDTEAAKEELMKIKGVGPKVASCVLLFGFHKLDAFPVDVWIKKVLLKYYGNKVPDFGRYGGVAQQYLFFGERNIKQ